jgi:hypothetical protein
MSLFKSDTSGKGVRNGGQYRRRQIAINGKEQECKRTDANS